MGRTWSARLMSRAVPVIGTVAVLIFAERSMAAPRSAVHPLTSPIKASASVSRPVYYQVPPAPLGMSITGDRWAIYSRGVNRINASVVRGNETWLATDMGVKLIDRSRHTVTHFTRLDGLPDDRVTALAIEPDAAWAIVAAKHGEVSVAALCEYRRATHRWHVLRETPRPVVAVLPANNGANPPYNPGSPLENTLVAACPEKVCFALSPVRRDNSILALCYDRRLNLWDEIPCPPAFMADRTSISTSWLDVDRNAVWLGTTAGLLRYRLREKQWQRFMPETMVYAAAKADDGTLWLADYQGSTQLIDHKTPANEANLPSGHWFATHFFPKSALVKRYQIPEAAMRQPAYGIRSPIMFSGVSIADRGVWLTPGSRSPYGAPTPFLRLYPQEETWRAYLVQNQVEMDAIPDVALEQPTLPRTTLLSGYFPWRLTDWVCADGETSPQDGQPKNAPTNKDADGTLWATDGRALMQTDSGGAILRRFGLGQVSLAVTPQVSAVTVLKGTVYAMSSGDLQAYDLRAGEWRRIRLPRTGWSNPSDERLIPDGDRLWVGTPSTVYRYDPNGEQFSVESTTQNGGYRLLGSIGAKVWVRGPDNLLYQSDLRTGEPETADIAPLPPEISKQYDKGIPFGVAAGIIWFRLQDKKDAEKGLYIGYDPQAGSWTPAHAVPKPYPTPPTCLGIGLRSYIPMAEDDSSVRCYDAETRQWTIAAPKEPQGHGLYSLTVISVDEEELWSLDNNTRALLCFHRKAATWTLHQIPQSFWVQQTGNEVVRAGDEIYFATNLGVWTFHVATKAWTQLPGFLSRDVYLNGMAVEPSAVWSIARPTNGNQSFAVRLDKVTRRWSAWSEKEGFPERLYPNVIIPDGTTAWVLASGECFHLDAASNRWISVSAVLAQDKPTGNAAPAPAEPAGAARVGKVQVGDIVPDGDSVWILPAGMLSGEMKASDNAILVRYDRITGKLDRFTPAPDLKLVGRSMQVNRDAVWIPTASGVYRFAKGDRSWRKVDPPASALPWAKFEARSVLQVDRTYWFFGVDDAVRWEE